MIDGALAAAAAAAELAGFGAGDDGCGKAYSANTAGRLATSLSVVAVEANSSRCGGNVGTTLGTTEPGLEGGPFGPPGAPGPEILVVPDSEGAGLGAPDAAGLAEPPGLATADGATVCVTMGGGVETVSSSATARR